MSCARRCVTEMGQRTPISVVVSGCRGKMGRMVLEELPGAHELALVAAIDRDEDLAHALKSTGAEVLIDFTEPGVGADHLDLALELGVHPVIGTTGIHPTRLEAAAERARARGIGGVVAPNFAVGAVLMMELARRAAVHLPAVEIIESHHPAKKDAPSGTALLTRQRIQGKRMHIKLCNLITTTDHSHELLFRRL